MLYKVKLSAGKTELWVQKKKDKSRSSDVGVVKSDDIVVIDKIDGKRAHITKPVSGWVDFSDRGFDGVQFQVRNMSANICGRVKTQTAGQTISKCHRPDLKSATDNAAQNISTHARGASGAEALGSQQQSQQNEDALLHAALLESKSQYIEVQVHQTIEQMNIIRNHLKINGPRLLPDERDEMQARLVSLEAKAKAFLMAPNQWHCKACTFVNKAKALKCEMCQAESTTSAAGLEELAQLTTALNNSLQQATSQAGLPDDRIRESELIFPPSTADREVTELQQRVALLEEDSWQHQTEVEALKSQMLSMCSRYISLDREPREWDVTTVGVWLSKNGLQDYVEDFAFGSVDGEVLLALTNEDLKAEPLTVGRKHREKILLLTEKLRQKFPVAGIVSPPKEVERNPKAAQPEAEQEESPSPEFGATDPKEHGIQDQSFVQFDEIGRPLGGESVAFSYVKTDETPFATTGPIPPKPAVERKPSASPVLVQKEPPPANDSTSSLKDLPLEKSEPDPATRPFGALPQVAVSPKDSEKDESSEEDFALECCEDDFELL